MHKYVFFLLLWLIVLGGCDDSQKRLKESELERAAVMQKIELVEAGGGLVLMVGGETLTSDEVINSKVYLDNKAITPMEHYKQFAQTVNITLFKQRVREQFEQVVMDKISNVVLYQYARKQAGKNVDASLEMAAENEYRRYVLGFGGNQAKADEELQKRGLDRKRFMERLKRDILIQSYVTSKYPDNRPITHGDLLECYDDVKDQQFAKDARIRFRLIDIQPDKLTITDPNQDRRQLAEQLAAQLLARIRSGEDFGALAKEYSNGPMKAYGGLWRPMQPTSLVAPYDTLAAETEKIQQDEIAGPIVVEDRIFIMKLEEKQVAAYEPFEAVQEQVRKIIIQKRRNETLAPLYARLRRQARLGRTDEFIDFCLEEIHRMSRSPQQQPSGIIESQNVDQ